jgi:hypothetical protein
MSFARVFDSMEKATAVLGGAVMAELATGLESEVTESDVIRLWEVFAKTAAALAVIEESTPRAVFEDAWKRCPTDEKFRADIEAKLEDLRARA